MKVDLFVATPSNIPAESFEVYGVALALVSQAFMSKKPHLIQDADNLFQQLRETKIKALPGSYASRVGENREIDFSLERGLCSLLVGKIDESRAWLGLDNEDSPYRDPSIVSFVIEHSRDDDEDDFLPGLCKLLETWLMEVVFPRFRETQDIRFKLGDYYDDPTVLRYLDKLEGEGRSPLAVAAAIARIGAEATAVLDNVKVSALHALQKVFPPANEEKDVRLYDKSEVNGYDLPLASENRERLPDQNKPYIIEIPEKNSAGGLQQQEMIADNIKDATVKIMCAGLAIGALTLAGLKFLPRVNSSIQQKGMDTEVASDEINVGMITTS